MLGWLQEASSASGGVVTLSPGQTPFPHIHPGTDQAGLRSTSRPPLDPSAPRSARDTRAPAGQGEQSSPVRTCGLCPIPLRGRARSSQRWCSARCRSRAYRQRQRGPVQVCSTCRHQRPVALWHQRPVALFCMDATRRNGREPRCRPCRAASRGYVRTGYPTSRPERIKYPVGFRFASLVIVQRLGTRNGSTIVVCKCDCNKARRFCLQNLIAGMTIHCGDKQVHPASAAS